MIQLNSRGIPINIESPTLATIFAKSINNDLVAQRADGGTIALYKHVPELNNDQMIVGLQKLDNLTEGDIVYINTNGAINTLYRRDSLHNALFITDRCNSNCLMCSQPPKNHDDLSHFYAINTALISMIPKDTLELGITGGEPTLLGQRFLSLLAQLKYELSSTEIHILSNGRSFAWRHVAQSISKVDNRRTVYGIPLYSDDYRQHDYIVQAKDAFNQTVLGMHNMARYNQRMEVRVVLHKQSYRRLPQLAKYIYRNLPFIEHVAFMGLEYTGYTVKNHDLLWMEPVAYAEELEEAVLYLHAMGMNVSIYNLQLCLLKQSLWPFAQKSISDWKQNYLAECSSCSKLDSCGGVFETSKRHSTLISAIR
ncbi:His-Xaa-Ser system radical SAM maturase HxsC [Sphingobacterium bambusae]|uniref:His-Xaa-Ser system radical SAM maturase HxsC n=1 Tax=Sphingobacterium bambusae TaxID=662858 RepID=A0ABW6BLH1_9SPHI|nr:His-Xaa-Ser system radical SAM maturase HxsC [Sphingobacterium bambusae]WPL49363.1 His-Xaa-Ser system radical SAM maturase HxsC [Sphingobacterium bambusae]